MSADEDARPAQDDDLPAPVAELVRRWQEQSDFPYPPDDGTIPEPVDPAAQVALRLALERLEASSPGSALHALERADLRKNVLARSIEFVARGLLAESAGMVSAAIECFDEAFALGVPSPTILAKCGGFFRRHGRFIEAYHCFSLLGQIDPEWLTAYTYSLSADQLLRYSPAIVPKLLTAERPLFYVVHPLKRKLVEELGEAGAAIVLGELIGQASPWQAVRLELAGLHDYALERALVYEELAAPKPVEMTEPEFVGEETGPPISGSTRTVFFSVLPDIVVPSKSSFLLAEHRVLMDYQGNELTHGPLWFDVDPAVLASDGRRLTVLRHDETGRMPPLDEALSLVGMYSYNFAHFIVEKLFKVLACIGRPGFESVPILVDQLMQPAHRQMLDLFLGPEHPIVVIPPGASVHVSRLWSVSSPVYWPGCEVPGSSPLPHEELADVEFLAKLLSRVQPALAAVDHDRRQLRVLLTRKDYRLANRHEVEEWCKELGWLVVDPADLSFVEQLRLTRNARSVAVIDGAGKNGLFFARPGLRVGLLCSSPHQGPPHEELHLFNEMMRALGHRLLALPGQPTSLHPIWAVFSPFRIEREALVPFLEQVDSLDALAE